MSTFITFHQWLWCGLSASQASKFCETKCPESNLLSVDFKLFPPHCAAH